MRIATYFLDRFGTVPLKSWVVGTVLIAVLWIRIQECKNDPQKRKIFQVLKCGMF
jgi:hypothetical protein